MFALAKLRCKKMNPGLKRGHWTAVVESSHRWLLWRFTFLQRTKNEILCRAKNGYYQLTLLKDTFHLIFALFSCARIAEWVHLQLFNGFSLSTTSYFIRRYKKNTSRGRKYDIKRNTLNVRYARKFFNMFTVSILVYEERILSTQFLPVKKCTCHITKFIK